MKYILAADDEPMNLDILQEILADDYEVSCVENGIDCLSSIDERIPDLLLLDYAMPRMDGLEVLQKLRSNDETRELPVIMLSGFATSDRIEKAMNAGATEYVTKPFMPNDLLNVIAKHIG